jgi:hypothetical protein
MPNIMNSQTFVLNCTVSHAMLFQPSLMFMGNSGTPDFGASLGCSQTLDKAGQACQEQIL